MAIRTVIMGAAGRDFHNFNVYFRDNDAYDVVAFTAAQIPDIAGRAYPPELAGARYPKGIPIIPEEELPALIDTEAVELVVFAYSDVSHDYVMHRASIANAGGADFALLGWRHTALTSRKPVVAVCAVRTGAGKSQTTRRVVEILAAAGKKVAVIRHPMPYGDLVRQTAQRFASYDDLDAAGCTIEEREEYEPHLARGHVVFAGVDYEKILRMAEAEADVVVWDGGNNDTPFYVSDLLIVVADPLRPGHELKYYPGETNFRMADVILINKVDSARPEDIDIVKENAAAANPSAVIIEAESEVTAEDPGAIAGKRVLCVEDGPTLTHGEMSYGAAVVAAKRAGAAELVDPRPYLVGSLRETFEKYPHIGALVPAMGYGAEMVADLEATVNATPADVVVAGTPIDLGRIIKVNKPIVRVRYDLKVVSAPTLEDVVRERLKL
ncbi:MAG TPA: cyclic 2,3-diphosphoglycerate synthase [bacterium]|nr:cyclic 2,3-diphosphoglycerate synthase [bacterium]